MMNKRPYFRHIKTYVVCIHKSSKCLLILSRSKAQDSNSEGALFDVNNIDHLAHNHKTYMREFSFGKTKLKVWKMFLMRRSSLTTEHIIAFKLKLCVSKATYRKLAFFWVLLLLSCSECFINEVDILDAKSHKIKTLEIIRVVFLLQTVIMSFFK